MYELTSALPAWAPYAATGAGGAALAAAAAWGAGRRTRRRSRVAGLEARRTSRGDLATAAIATAVSAEGMWETFGALDMPIPLRAATFAFIELAIVQSARRARRSMTEKYTVGVDGVAMWILTLLTAVLSAAHELASDKPNPAVVLVRLAAPPVAAWGWERNMALERRHRGLPAGINWRITPERILIRLGIAEPGERTAADVDKHRRVAAVARAAKRARRLEETTAARWRRRRAMARVDRLYEEADEYTRLSEDTELQQELLAQVGALYNTQSLVRLTARPWWSLRDTGAEPSPSSGRDECVPPATAASPLLRMRESRTDRRLGLRRGRRTAARPPDDVQARTAPPLTLPSVRPLPVRPARAGLAWLDRTGTLSAGTGIRAHRTVRVPFTQPVWPLNPMRPTEPPVRSRPPRAKRKAAPARKASKGARKPKSYWIALLADEILAAADQGRAWEPFYNGPDGLLARTGYGQSWCEKTVRAAKQRAKELIAARIEPVPARTGTADT